MAGSEGSATFLRENLCIGDPMFLRSLATLLALTSAAPALAQERPATLSPWTTTVVRGTAPPPVALEATHPISTQSVTTLAGAHALKGVASFYWHGEKTASGEPFDKGGLTAAHPTLPFNTLVKVTEVGSGRSVVVRINDRGPFKPGRVIDVSERAAEILGFTGHGLAKVELEVLP